MATIKKWLYLFFRTANKFSKKWYKMAVIF